MNKELQYENAVIEAREAYVRKVRASMNKNLTDSARRLLKLIDLVPNWETYLTDKQVEVARRYIKTYNAYEVDHQLRLTPGSTHQRLFGNRSSAGVVGRLEKAYKRLNESGFYQSDKSQDELGGA